MRYGPESICIASFDPVCCGSDLYTCDRSFLYFNLYVIGHTSIFSDVLQAHQVWYDLDQESLGDGSVACVLCSFLAYTDPFCSIVILHGSVASYTCFPYFIVFIAFVLHRHSMLIIAFGHNAPWLSFRFVNIAVGCV